MWGVFWSGIENHCAGTLEDLFWTLVFVLFCSQLKSCTHTYGETKLRALEVLEKIKPHKRPFS